MEKDGKTAHVRDKFLQGYRSNKTPAVIIMRNGFQIRGAIINDFDDRVVAAEIDGAEQMINDAAISTIAPLHRQSVRPSQHWTNADWKSPARDFIRDT